MTPRPVQDELLDDQIQVRYPARELARIREFAKAMRTSPQEIIRECTRQWLLFAEQRGGPTFLFTVAEAERIQAVAEDRPNVVNVPEGERLTRKRKPGA